MQLCLQMPSAGGNRKQAGEGSVGIGEACATAKLAPAEPHVISQSVSLTSTSTPGLLQWPAHQGKRLRCCNSAQLGRGTGLVLIVCHFPPFAGRPFLGRWKRPTHLSLKNGGGFRSIFPSSLPVRIHKRNPNGNGNRPRAMQWCRDTHTESSFIKSSGRSVRMFSLAQTKSAPIVSPYRKAKWISLGNDDKDRVKNFGS